MAGLIMIAVLHKKKTKSAQYRFLVSQRAAVLGWLGGTRLPARSCYFSRYRRAHRLYRVAIRLQAEQALTEGVIDARHVAVDKSLLAAQGPVWHQADRRGGTAPAGVDRTGTWGFSEWDGWVYGFSYEVVVTATPGTTVFPLLASVDTASTSEMSSFAPKIAELSKSVRTVSADSGYDGNDLAERVEWDGQGRRTGRRFLCPENPRNNGRSKTKPCSADAGRARSRARRRRRQRFLQSRRGRSIYARRRKTVEPFNQWFKSLFELDQRVWHRGLDNNRTQLLAAIFSYQLLVRYNHRRGNANGRVRWLLDAL
jgi:hypothetical protein